MVKIVVKQGVERDDAFQKDYNPDIVSKKVTPSPKCRLSMKCTALAIFFIPSRLAETLLFLLPQLLSSWSSD